MQSPANTRESGGNGQADAKPTADAGTAVSREITNVIADAEDLIKTTTSLTGEDLARFRAQFAKGVATAKRSLGEMGNSIADGARKSATNTNVYVHEHPWQVIGAIAAVSFLVGFLVTRRR
jgi:ElaB/YqjD/DUF883 family membrane-anchored ribosome-binding protein